MRTFHCSCGETLFFDNARCETCGSEVGFCPQCRVLSALKGNTVAGYTCGNTACGVRLTKCNNYAYEHVCNRCIATPADGPPAEPFCDYCRYNVLIPDLSKPGNREKWAKLEAAKRRMFYQLDLLGLPHGTASDGFEPPLSFEFKEDVSSPEGLGTMGLLDDRNIVMTGHAVGKITINLREADPVEREKLRVQFGEPNRSLIGHFRHEMGHYYWELLIKGRCEGAFIEVFGDFRNPAYNEALNAYYNSGPPKNWKKNYASAYASMHPWEDFAETFTAYLEMVGTLDTAKHMELGGDWIPWIFPGVEFDNMIAAYHRLGKALNEMNRTMGLKDLLTRPLVGAVVVKMRYVHQLILDARKDATRPWATQATA